eukprot:TRINITY_DN29946_c0_g1_i2.p1 TRINITY_DN29946_c0_g1~~TRINITY_DN29946_c0_g1_i2.p1  ORF type:complete len:101 (+),score=1.35 TRINITY_DN29946_c0_g1_i2:344-646(+)
MTAPPTTSVSVLPWGVQWGLPRDRIPVEVWPIWNNRHKADGLRDPDPQEHIPEVLVNVSLDPADDPAEPVEPVVEVLSAILPFEVPVSYTHLTLPTKRIV